MTKIKKKYRQLIVLLFQKHQNWKVRCLIQAGWNRTRTVMHMQRVCQISCRIMNFITGRCRQKIKMEMRARYQKLVHLWQMYQENGRVWMEFGQHRMQLRSQEKKRKIQVYGQTLHWNRRCPSKKVEHLQCLSEWMTLERMVIWFNSVQMIIRLRFIRLIMAQLIQMHFR